MPEKENKNPTKKTRRGRNEGSVRWMENKKLYQARYPTGIDEKGKTIYKSIYGKKKTGPDGVLAKMRDALSAIGKGTYVEPVDKTLLVLCKEWYYTDKEPSIRANTRDKYEQSIKRLGMADIANMLVKDINSDLIQKYYNSLKKKGLAYATISATHALINGALNKAELTNKILKNPARLVIIPKDEGETEVKALTDAEYDLFMGEMARCSSYYMFAIFMANTGLRPGEAIALNRADINFNNKTVNVKATYLPASKTIQNSTKTASSKRIVPIPNNILKILKEYMFKQKNKKPSDPIFQTKKGTRYTSRNALRQFQVVGERINCDWVNLHSMRHTFASRLFQKKVDVKVISKLLGHKKVSTTYDIYIHFINDIVEESVQLLNSGVPEALPQRVSKKATVFSI